MAKYNHTVTEEELGMTINEILRANYKFSARFKTKMKFQSLVDLNGVPTKGFIKPNLFDVISIRLPEETSDFPPEDIPLDIIYEDDDIIAVNKQPGIIVHPTHGHPTGTVANAVMKYMQDSGQSFKVRFANRIDMDTTGIIIVAKNANAQDDISNQMRAGTTVKKYKAIVHGIIEKDVTIDLPVGRPSDVSIQREVMMEGGKDAVTDVHVLEHFREEDRKNSDIRGDYSLVELTIHTGRTHQIRVHLSHIGHPIIGDELYGGRPDLINRQALHAYYLGLKHPHTHEDMEIVAPLPEDFEHALEKLLDAKMMQA